MCLGEYLLDAQDLSTSALQWRRGRTDLDESSDGIGYHPSQQTSFRRAIDLVASRLVVEHIIDDASVRVPMPRWRKERVVNAMRSSSGREGRGSRIGTCLGKEELDSVRRVEDVSNEDLTGNAGPSSTRRWRDATGEHVPEADRNCVSIRIGEARVERIVDVAGVLRIATFPEVVRKGMQGWNLQKLTHR